MPLALARAAAWGTVRFLAGLVLELLVQDAGCYNHQHVKLKL